MRKQEGNSDLFTRAGLLAAQLNPIQLGLGPEAKRTESKRFFYFFIFISVFYKNIFSIWKFTEIYPGRSAVGRQGLICKKIQQKIADRSLGTGRRAA